MTHEQLVTAAKTAIDRVFADTSVSPAETRASLEELCAEIEIKLDTLP